jgi:hypothetical protein
MNERMRFVTDWERGLYSMVELCERYGVSRKTGYQWVERYEREGPDGLRERSRAPHHCPHRIAAEVAAAICAGRRQHPSWGPEKILHWLKWRQPELEMPATSTAGDLLARQADRPTLRVARRARLDRHGGLRTRPGRRGRSARCRPGPGRGLVLRRRRGAPRGLTRVDTHGAGLEHASPLERRVTCLVAAYQPYLEQDLRFDDTTTRRLLPWRERHRPTLCAPALQQLIELALGGWPPVAVTRERRTVPA